MSRDADVHIEVERAMDVYFAAYHESFPRGGDASDHDAAVRDAVEAVMEHAAKQVIPDVDWLRGYFAAMNDYAIWNNGVQRIGVMAQPLKDRKRELLAERGWDGKSPLPDGLEV